MTNEEKSKYQAYAVKVMKHKLPVLFNGHKYRALRMCFGFKPNGEEYMTVELADLNGCDSLITAGLEEFYKENNKEEKNESVNAKQ